MNAIEVVKKYFGDVRPVQFAEIKALGLAAIRELADDAAAQMGLKPVEVDGKKVYA